MRITFEWDEEKAKKNLQKHKINFAEAKTVFNDPFLFTFPDCDCPDKEQRFINIGNSVKERVLIIVHTERGQNIRIISCRKATRAERKVYEEGCV